MDPSQRTLSSILPLSESMRLANLAKALGSSFVVVHQVSDILPVGFRQRDGRLFNPSRNADKRSMDRRLFLAPTPSLFEVLLRLDPLPATQKSRPAQASFEKKYNLSLGI